MSSQQKHGIRVIHCKDRFTHVRQLIRVRKILNVFELNIFKNLVSMHKIKSQVAPTMFQNRFCKPIRKYPTNFPTFNYSIPPFKLNQSKYKISIRGHKFRKNISTNLEKMQERVTIFKISTGAKLLEIANKVTHF